MVSVMRGVCGDPSLPYTFSIAFGETFNNCVGRNHPYFLGYQKLNVSKSAKHPPQLFPSRWTFTYNLFGKSKLSQQFPLKTLVRLL